MTIGSNRDDTNARDLFDLCVLARRCQTAQTRHVTVLAALDAAAAADHPAVAAAGRRPGLLVGILGTMRVLVWSWIVPVAVPVFIRLRCVLVSVVEVVDVVAGVAASAPADATTDMCCRHRRRRRRCCMTGRPSEALVEAHKARPLAAALAVGQRVEVALSPRPALADVARADGE